MVGIVLFSRIFAKYKYGRGWALLADRWNQPPIVSYPWGNIMAYFKIRFMNQTALLSLSALIGCAKPPEITPADLAEIDFDAALTSCCAAIETHSPAAIRLIDNELNSLLPLAHNIVLRPSYLEGQVDAQAFLLGDAKPLDLILVNNGSRLSGANSDGYFGHSALYTGSESDLRGLGIWNHPAVAKFHQRIRAGGIAIESIDLGVRLSDAPTLMEADHAAIFRATGLSRSRKAEALIYLFTEIGRPFDHHFDLDRDDGVFCTELIHDALPEMRMPVRFSYGRRVIWPDEVATKSFVQETGFRFLTSIRGTPVGWFEEDQDMLAARILQAWGQL